MKKVWVPMRLRFVGRVSELMQGMGGSFTDPHFGPHHKVGSGGH
jgi:hypothetical protein